MIRLSRRAQGDPVLTEMTLIEGHEPFRIELVPFPEDEQARIFAEFRKYKKVVNPISKSVELLPYLDIDGDNDRKLEDKLNDELDRVVRNFWGIADADGKELDGSLRQNKLLLGSVKVDRHEDVQIEDESGGKGVIRQKRSKRFRLCIFEEAARLAETIAEAETKNSGAPLRGTTETDIDTEP